MSTAIITPGRTVDHAELTGMVDELAMVLRGHGVGPERVCAIALERGVDSVVAMAAVLRAGGAFLTVDVDLPRPRLAALLADAHLVITHSGIACRFTCPNLPTVLVDQRAPVRHGVPLPEPDPRSLAYLSHTSGSTGTPNAVLVQRESLDSYLWFVTAEYDLGPATVALQLAPMGYDASIRDTLAPLLAGGSLVVLPRSTLLRPAELFDAIEEYGVNTILSATPSLLAFLAGQDGAAARLGGLRLVVASGESMRPFLAADCRRVFGGRLVNQYGPTETTMTATWFDVPAQPDTEVDLVGGPIDGMLVRLLDDRLRAVPDGAVGEIYLGGIGVARGYAGKPGLTADRFVPDPLGEPGTRLYRTGDLARHDPAGELAYLGRSDRQIKIRGYRVDPAEVEAALLTHPGLTGAVITPAVDAAARTYLVAHVIGDLAGVADTMLRAHLAATLPPHLMPRRFTRLERFPTTRSGKVDRVVLAGGVR